MSTRRVDGVLLLDKPCGVSSNAALQSAKRLVRAAKAGHAGTLDPLASGLLPILLGEATKLSQLALDADKEYLARAHLGIVTSTGDAEGEVRERHPCTVRPQDVEPVLARFRGTVEQIPPMYSALKREGRPLYEMAREGREIAREARRVQVYELAQTGLEGDRLELRIRCSKGTYVRTLVEDIGRALGCGAYLAGLRRVAAAGFGIDEALTLEELAAMDPLARDRRLLPMERLLGELPRVELPAELADRFRQGQVLRLAQAPAGRCGVFLAGGPLLGLGEGLRSGELRPRRLVHHATG